MEKIKNTLVHLSIKEHIVDYFLLDIWAELKLIKTEHLCPLILKQTWHQVRMPEIDIPNISQLTYPH